jgi:hypothetical protein
LLFDRGFNRFREALMFYRNLELPARVDELLKITFESIKIGAHGQTN